MNGSMKPEYRSAFLKRLLRDQTGNTLAMVAASIIPIIGLVGGAVDMGRGYMAKARLQQACDAGALAARSVMDTATLTTDNKTRGYQYFDFNYPAGSYATTNLVRTYIQPTSNTGVLQPLVQGTASVKLPTTLMRVFGNEELDLSVECTSKKDVSNADVAMVLDVTGSMSTQMDKDASGTTTESRITALRRSVRAFYDSLGPGRAAGDTTKGRVRYGIVPYGTVANVGYLLNHNQMVNSHTYSSRQPNATTLYSWVQGSEVKAPYSAWAGSATTPATVITASQNAANYSSYNTTTTGSGTGSYSYTRLNDLSFSVPRTITSVPKTGGGTETATSTNCYKANSYTAGSSNTSPGIVDVRRVPASTNETNTALALPAPVHPQASRLLKNWLNTETNATQALRYRWFKVGSTNACRIEMATSGTADTSWTRTQTTTSSAPLTWTTHAPGTGFVYNERTVDVSGLKPTLGTGWNSTLTVPNINITGASWYNVKLSGRDKKLSGDSTVDDWTSFSSSGTASAGSVTWRGCVEERSTETGITSTTPLTPIPSLAYDLDVTDVANTSNDATRWRPWLHGLSFTPTGTSQSDECPSPAIRLQEFSSYTAGVLTSNYPDLFDNTSGGTSSYYYPYSTTAANNVQSFQNYIDRIGLVDGTIHDSGFIWGMHLLSGQGMFAANNPDFFDGSIVSRNIVFMTDGDLNPGQDRYVYSGLNNVDGRLAPKTNSWTQMLPVHNRRLRILCEAAKAQGITVWVVIIKDGVSTDTDLRACASSSAHFKSANTADELVSSFTVIAQSIGGLRLTH